MRLLRTLGRSLLSLATGLLLLVMVTAVYLVLRVTGFEQVDDEVHMTTKQNYLQSIREAPPELDGAPNIIFILYDDLGYGDIGFGARDNALLETPHFDRLADQGLVFSDFHSPAPVCTPSRAGFLTGRLAPRAGLPDVIFPKGSLKELLANKLPKPEGNIRLPAEEITLAELLSAAGYHTGMIGKWHLGDRSPSLPNDMGFDNYFGALYSNDMEPFALYRDRDIAVPAPADQRRLTEWYTDEAISFIERGRNKPFFLYFAHNFPHDPLYVRDSRSGQSRAGLYGDVLEEIDEGIGAIVATLERTGKLENTLIFISSDNGPWFLGNAGDQRGRKGNTFEGGMRVPFIAHWPAKIDGGSHTDAMAMGIDLFPTILELLDIEAPPDRVLDGKSLLRVLRENADSPHDYLYYYDGETLFAVRDQRFKYRGPAGVFYATDQMPVGGAFAQKEWLFDLQGDPRESYDTSNRHPERLRRLRAAFDARKREMATNPRGWR